MGWYGFNAGSTFKANEIAGFAAMNSQIAGYFLNFMLFLRSYRALSSLSWMILDILTTGRPTLDGVMNGFTTELIFFTPYVGTIAGLVGITPAVGYVTPSGALVIGIVSGIGCHYGIKVKTLFNFDDSLDAFGIHAVAGIAGGVLTGLLAHVHEAQGTFHGNTKQVGIQLFGITITILWSAVGTAVVFFLVDALFGLRVSKESEAIGLDLVLHGNTITQQASKATRKERPEDQDICCRLHCPCLVFIIRRPNNQPESTSI